VIGVERQVSNVLLYHGKNKFTFDKMMMRSALY